MPVNGHSSNDGRALSIRQRLKGIIYVQSKNVIVPEDSSQPTTRSRPLSEQCAFESDKRKGFNEDGMYSIQVQYLLNLTSP
jgi:hypothetical protein